MYSTKEYDLESYFQKVGELVDVAVMRDKNSGRSRGFAFVTFVVYPTQAEVESTSSKDFSNCRNALELNKEMLKPLTPHLI